MQNNIELTAEQLSNLDLVISEKQKNDGFFIEAHAVCTPLLMVHIAIAEEVVNAAVAAVTGEPFQTLTDHLSVMNFGKNISLSNLLELRNKSILKR